MIESLFIFPIEKCAGTYRALFDTGRNVIIEGNNKASKQAKPWVRLRERTEDLSSPMEELHKGKPLNHRERKASITANKKSSLSRSPTDPTDGENIAEQEPLAGGDDSIRDISPSYGKHQRLSILTTMSMLLD